MSTKRYSKVRVMDPTLFGRLVLVRRRDLRLDRHQVACLANVDDDKVAIIEDGQAEPEDMPEAERICRTLGLDRGGISVAGEVDEAA